jgi:hypothetical protein
MLIMQKRYDGITINTPLQVLCARIRAQADNIGERVRSGEILAENTQLYEATQNEIYESRDS